MADEYITQITESDSKPDVVHTLYVAAFDEDMSFLRFEKILNAAVEKFPDAAVHLIAQIAEWV